MNQRCQLSFRLSALSNLSLLKSSGVLAPSDVILNTSWIFESIVNAWDEINDDLFGGETNESTRYVKEDKTEAEREERVFREQFPSHEEEFERIIESVEGVNGDYEMQDDNVETYTSKITKVNVTDEIILSICNSHARFYSSNPAVTNDATRIRSFILTYEAAHRLNYVTSHTTKLRSERCISAAHFFFLDHIETTPFLKAHQFIHVLIHLMVH